MDLSKQESLLVKINYRECRMTHPNWENQFVSHVSKTRFESKVLRISFCFLSLFVYFEGERETESESVSEQGTG